MCTVPGGKPSAGSGPATPVVATPTVAFSLVRDPLGHRRGHRRVDGAVLFQHPAVDTEHLRLELGGVGDHAAPEGLR